MPKFWLPTEDIIHSHQLVNEDMWFRLNQPLLLAMANTKFGRDLLCIPQDYPRVVKMTKCSVHCHLGGDKYIADFRIGAKWTNVIRYRWSQFSSYARYFEFRSPALIQRETGISRLASERLAVTMATLTAYPNPHPESTTCDGEVSIGGTSTTWATVRDASAGTYGADASVADMLPMTGKNAGGQFEIRRSFLLFDTSSLTTEALISATVLSLYATGGVNPDNDGNDFFTIVTSTPASNTNLVLDDFDQLGSVEQHDTGQRKDYDAISTSAYNDWTFNATGISGVSKTGVSKYGCREGHDFLNDPYGGANNSFQYRIFSTADVSGTSQDPKLVVTYILPNANFLLMF